MTDLKWERLIERFMEGGVTVLTGVGVSTDSGLPDFRGRAGLWNDLDLGALLTAEGASKRFDEFTTFCKAALREVLPHKPNMTHAVLAELQDAGLIGPIITQNVDGYDIDAGAKNVIELHGNIRRIGCIGCGQPATPDEYLGEGGEVCTCGGRRRPAIVLFGEQLAGRFLIESVEALAETRLLLAIGTKLEVAPVAFAPAIVVKNGGAFAVFNGEPIEQDDLAEFKRYGPINVTMRDLYDWVVKFDRKRHGLLEHQEVALKLLGPASS